MSSAMSCRRDVLSLRERRSPCVSLSRYAGASNESASKARSRAKRMLSLQLTTAALFGLACSSYPARTESALAEFQRGELTKALASFEDPNTTGSPFLAGAEAGSVALTAGEWDHAVQ